MDTIDESLLIGEAPQSLQIEVTSRCNLKCKMCPLTAGSTLSSTSPGHMTNSLWHDILPLAKRYRNVILSGYGEPFLNPSLLSLLQELNSAKVNMGMSTNGTLLTRSITRELAALEYIVHFNVSIDSPEIENYHYIRGGHVKKALKGLENLLADIKDPNIVTVSSILMNNNIRDLVSFPAILAELGVRKFFLQGLLNYNVSCSEEQLLHKPEVFSYLDEIHQQCKKAGIEIIMPLVERLELERSNPQKAVRHFHSTAMDSGETKQCLVPWEVPFIDMEGRIFPCCNASGDVTAIMGDLMHESWDEIWNGQRFRDFRKRLLNGTNIPLICQGCNAQSRGKHPLLSYALKIIFEQSRLSGRGPIKLVVRNIGRYTWTQNDSIRIGTSAPRDRSSRLWKPTWINSNRAATFKEKQVSPGSLATFEFKVNRSANLESELFELVYDGKIWMHNTQFRVNVPPKMTANLLLYVAKIIGIFRTAFYKFICGGTKS